MTVTLSSILELTDRVQVAIDSCDWQLAAQLESERRSLLEAFFAEARTRGTVAEDGVALGELHERNRRLIGDVHHHRRRVLRDASMIRTGQAAVDAYGATRAET